MSILTTEEKLLARIENNHFSPTRILDMMTDFVRRVHPDEKLDPKWIDIWNKYKDIAEDYFPKFQFDELESKFSNIVRIDDQVWELNFKPSSKVTFLLGAGASAPSNIPTVNNLLTSLWDNAKKLNREDVDKLSAFCAQRGIKNIEDLLTAAYLSNYAAQKNSVISLLDYFLFSQQNHDEEFRYREQRYRKSLEVDASSISFLQDTLQILFGLLTSTMITAHPNDAHNAIVDFVKIHKNTTIITTNYDCCIDEALSQQDISLKGTIGFENNKSSKDAIELIKMHGSINWAYCESCQYAKEFNFLEMKKAYTDDSLSYPVIGICKKCTGQRRPMLVPPLSLKFMMFPSLIELWNNARQSIECADYLVIIGYSFSDADTYITKIVSRSMSMNPNQKMIVVTTDKKLVTILRNRFSVNIENFEKHRIIEVCESCDKILPRILSTDISSEKSPKIIASSLSEPLKKSIKKEKMVQI